MTPRENGGYEIISGHRRKAAIRFLLDQSEKISRLLPCLVQTYANESDKEIDLIFSNVTARQLTDQELWQSYERVNANLQARKDAGEKFGRVRETIAATLGISPSQVSKLQNVERHAIPAVKEAVENGDLSISTAHEIARLDEAEQERLAAGDLSEVKRGAIRKKPARKVATSGNFSEDAPRQEPEKESDPEDDVEETDIGYLDDASESECTDIDEAEKVATSGNFSDDPETDSLPQTPEEPQDSVMPQEERERLFDTGCFNEIALGYLTLTLREMGMNPDEIRAAQAEMKRIFDSKSAQAAFKAYQES